MKPLVGSIITHDVDVEQRLQSLLQYQSVLALPDSCPDHSKGALHKFEARISPAAEASVSSGIALLVAYSAWPWHSDSGCGALSYGPCLTISSLLVHCVNRIGNGRAVVVLGMRTTVSRTRAVTLLQQIISPPPLDGSAAVPIWPLCFPLISCHCLSRRGLNLEGRSQMGITDTRLGFV